MAQSSHLFQQCNCFFSWLIPLILLHTCCLKPCLLPLLIVVGNFLDAGGWWRGFWRWWRGTSFFFSLKNLIQCNIFTTFVYSDQNCVAVGFVVFILTFILFIFHRILVVCSIFVLDMFGRSVFNRVFLAVKMWIINWIRYWW